MDNETTVEELKKKVRKFCEDRNWDQYHNPKDLAIGISTEANELLDIFRFKSETEMKALFQDETHSTHIKEEIADTLFFVLRFAQMNHLDLSECLDEKIKKNGQKYSIEKAYGNNAKYTDFN